MAKSDIQPNDLRAALALLTRLPTFGPAPHARGAQAAWAFPVVGAILAGICGLLVLLAFWVGMTPALAACVALAVLIVLTGAMHEDGLADSADGLWGGWDAQNRLQIMRDSRIGTYGVLALALSLLTRWAALTALFSDGQILGPLIASAALSRAAMPAMMTALPHARPDGLSARTGKPSPQMAAIAAAMGFALALFAMGGGAIVAVIAVGLTGWAIAKIAKAKLGGQTGDILGATQQLTEITALLTFVALLP